MTSGSIDLRPPRISGPVRFVRVLRMLVTLVLVLLCAYGAVGAVIYFAQGRLLFVATKDLYRTPEAKGWDYLDVSCEVDGERTTGWYVYAAPPSRGTFLFSHGNAGNMADRLESISIFRDLGFDVLVYDYGGYGESTGKPSEQRCYSDIRAMWRYLLEEREIPEKKIILFGRSLGAGPACQLATEVEAAAVVLESAFISVPEMASKLYPIFPVSKLVKHRFDNGSKIGGIRSPLLQIHSSDDTLIPFRHGHVLFEKAPEPKTFLAISGDHNEGFWTSGPLYTDGLESFLGPLLETPRPTQ